MLPSLDNELRALIKERSDLGAIEVFAENLKTLLLAAPLGPKRVLALDPGLRTGCKLAILDATGRCEGTEIVPLADAAQEASRLAAIIKRCRPDAVAVGNGTGGREALLLTRQAVREAEKPGHPRCPR